MRSNLPITAATNRLAGFNAQRESLLGEVEARILKACLERTAGGGDSSLEYLLNEVVFSELSRLESPRNRSEARQLSRWRDMSNRLLRMSDAEKRAALESLIRHYCRDIVGNFNPRVYRFAKDVVTPALSLLLSPVSGVRDGMAAIMNAGSQVHIQGPVEQIRALGERGTLVLTPTHSSNLDSIVLALGLVRAGLPPVTYGAGKNLFTNPFISYFMHNLGAYRVDRRLRFRLYKDVLKEYSTVLLERGYHSLFFPGGTRCRSNQIEDRLKLGLLGTSLAAFRNRAVSGDRDYRIFIVPVTINYQLVLEAQTLIEDYLAETGKSRFIIQDDEFSRLGRLAEFGRKILAHEGAVTLRFGEPLDPVGNRVDPDGVSLDRRGRRIDPTTYLLDADGQLAADPQRDAEYTRLLGDALVEGFHRNLVLNSTQLVARVLFDRVAAQARTRDIYRLLRTSPGSRTVVVADLQSGLDRLRARVTDNPAWGRVSPMWARASADDIIADAMRALSTYHTHPVAVRHGDHVHVEDMKLCFYYQNRAAHIPVEEQP